MSIEAMKLALDALRSAKGYIFHNVLSEPNKYDTAIEALRDAIEQAEQDHTYGYAKELAENIFKQHFASDEHYASGQVVWRVNDTVIGILTQIDNMVSGMVRKPKQAEKQQFNPDWDAMAVMVEEQQRMAKRIEELEQAEKQEPVAWADKYDIEREGHDFYVNRQQPSKDGAPLYTAPPQREWQGLTDEEIEKLVYDIRAETMGIVTTAYLARAIEAKLKEKNT